jgi:hypothetical protein
MAVERRCESGFWQFRPSFRRYGLTATRGNIYRQPPHSHSIVAGTYKHLKIRDFFSAYAKFTVTSTAKNFLLGAIDGDRCRMAMPLPRTRSKLSGG